jgi:hypothetical protein
MPKAPAAKPDRHGQPLMAETAGSERQLTGIEIPDDRFRATRSDQQAPALDPLPTLIAVN